MKYLLSLVAGLLAGCALALTLVYFNPLIRRQAEPMAAAASSFGYALDPAEIWLAAHNGKLKLPLVPADAPRLYEEGVSGLMLTAMPLRNPAGDPIAFASRLSMPSAGTGFLLAGLLVEDYWLVSQPGEGSVFVHAVNNDWPLLRDTLIGVDWLGRDWQGSGEYAPTRGPDPAGARLVGLTGSFAGARGEARERRRLDDYAGSLAALSGEIEYKLSGVRR